MFYKARVPLAAVAEGFITPTVPRPNIAQAVALVGSLIMPHNIYLVSGGGTSLLLSSCLCLHLYQQTCADVTLLLLCTSHLIALMLGMYLWQSNSKPLALTGMASGWLCLQHSALVQSRALRNEDERHKREALVYYGIESAMSLLVSHSFVVWPSLINSTAITAAPILLRPAWVLSAAIVRRFRCT